MATKKRSTMAKLERALMKDIDEREAKEEAKSSVRETLFPYTGVTAKSALRKASENANIDADPGEYKQVTLKILWLAETVIFVALKSMVTML
jgi:hypothetical protein